MTDAKSLAATPTAASTASASGGLAQIQAALADGKAEDVAVFNTEEQSQGLFVYMVVATARSARHAAALTERVKQAMRAAGRDEIVIETSSASQWTLIDGGDWVVHIMLAAAREYYHLESLWGMRPADADKESPPSPAEQADD